ncbi:MAG TPA: OB-fold domain-containing protein [Pseudonocardia sp.]
MTVPRVAAYYQPCPAELAGDIRPEPGPFWSSGADGVLRVGRCAGCARLLHPSARMCADCAGTAIGLAEVSGEATILACTTNHQRWLPELDTPYVIAVVGLDEDPRVRLTTNIVGAEPAEAVVGTPVRVEFRPVDDVWLPVFRPRAGQPKQVAVAPPGTAVRRPPTSRRFERRAVLAGVGRSSFGRRLDQSIDQLTLAACRAAIADAGLRSSDIDGVCAYPGAVAGHHRVGVEAIARRLGIEANWWCGAHEVPGQTGVVIAAMLAIAAGLCRHVLCWTAVGTDLRPGLYAEAPTGRVTGEPCWQAPFGALSPANWVALAASRYFACYGADHGVLGAVAMASRRHAMANPDALYREPLDLATYQAGRPISTPLRIYDCDVPCDGAVAVLVSAVESAGDLRQPAVRVDAVGTQLTERQSWDQGTLTHQQNVFGPARQLWSRASVSRPDIDLANLYDGFTFNVLCWLEALGFCGLGEAGDFLADGARIGPGGDLPVNPHGGQLSAGRSNGFGQLYEAVVQLRGQAGARQVDGAQVALVSSGGGIPANCMILTADR